MDINNDISIINRTLEWLRLNKPQQYEQWFFPLAEGRRRMRRIQAALSENPAIGAFGESQTGKSYQTNTILNRTDRAFTIKAPGYPGGVGFVDQINPVGDKREATGVVTRLTSFRNNPGRYNPDYPVIVKLLTPAQLVTICASGYYMNVRDYSDYTEEQLRDICAEITGRYGNAPEIPDAKIIEDDILDLKNYLVTYNKTGIQNIAHSDYFATVARLMRRIPASEWPSVFKYLWHKNQAITELFERLCADLAALDYAKEVYIPVEAVMHGGVNRNTIMSVACLNGLDEREWNIRTDVYVPVDGNAADLRRHPSMLTCDLCAVSAEIIFRIEPEYLDQNNSYCYDAAHESEPGYLPRSSRNKLADVVKKNLLIDNDLLDFPGARSAEMQDEAFFRAGNSDVNGQSVLVKLFLRGKIAYLFNYYSESHMMKMLLFCHHEEQSEVKNLYILIDQWVRHNVGETVADRSATLARTAGISPLFIVATKINNDMTPKNYAELNGADAINNRWEDRFRTVLLDAILNWSNVDWFRNWSAPGKSFSDTYLLRGLEYSSCTPVGNKMFEGYDVATSSPERKLMFDHDYYRLLRSTFVNNGSVRELFHDPELAWDVATTMNNDGSLFIIERMGKVAAAAADIRNEQIKKERDKIMLNVREILSREYDSENEAEKLEKNINTVYDLRWDFDCSCTADSYYFGHLIQALQVTEAECLAVVHDVLRGTDMTEELYNLHDYDLIRRKCRSFDGCRNDEEKWQRLMQTYRWPTRAIAEAQLERKQINPAILFNTTPRPRNTQTYIADRIVELWRGKMFSDTLMDTFTGDDNGFSPLLMKDLVETIMNSAGQLGLADVIADRIRHEVNVNNTANIKESLVSDIMATTVNDFVNDFGYSLMSAELHDKARRLARENHLPAFEYIDKQQKAKFTSEELAAMFETAFDYGSPLVDSFNDRYNKWLEYMAIAYVVYMKKSDVSPQANREAGQMIESITF